MGGGADGQNCQINIYNLQLAESRETTAFTLERVAGRLSLHHLTTSHCNTSQLSAPRSGWSHHHQVQSGVWSEISIPAGQQEWDCPLLPAGSSQLSMFVYSSLLSAEPSQLHHTPSNQGGSDRRYPMRGGWQPKTGCTALTSPILEWTEGGWWVHDNSLNTVNLPAILSSSSPLWLTRLHFSR